jgi:hypothetical protein
MKKEDIKEAVKAYIIGKSFIQLVFYTLSLPLGFILEGYVIVCFYTWFIQPVWDLPIMPLTTGVALVFLSKHTLFDRLVPRKDLKDEPVWATGSILLLYPIMALLVGFIIHLFAR